MERMDDLRRWIERLREGIELVEAAVYLLLLLPVLSLWGAIATGLPSGRFALDWVLWMGGVVALGVLALRGLKALRRSEYGAAPPRDPLTTTEVLTDGVAAALAPMLLTWSVSRLLHHDDLHGWDVVVGVIGAMCVVLPLRSAYRYAFRR